MKIIKRSLIWFFMSCKRLTHRFSFLILLLTIPVLIPVANNVMKDGNGVLNIILCSEGESDTVNNVINSLMENDGIIKFSKCNSIDEVENAVKNFDVDAAWVFVDNFEKKLDDYGKDPDADPLVKVIEREENIPLQLSREILYGALFDEISYSLHRNFVASNLFSQGEVSESEIWSNYYDAERNRNIVSLWRLDAGEVKETPNYLTTPLRGLMSIIVVLCSLTAALFYISDKNAGKYDWMPPKKRIAPAFALCLAATLFAGIAVLFALQISGLSVGFVMETIAMIIFIIMSVGFAMIFAITFSSEGKLGATLPGIMIIIMVLSPIFFNLKVLKPVRLLLPTHYYLQSVYNVEYLLYAIIYCAGIFGLVILINNFKTHNR